MNKLKVLNNYYSYKKNTCFINNNQYYDYVKIFEKRVNIEFLLNELERIHLNCE